MTSLQIARGVVLLTRGRRAALVGLAALLVGCAGPAIESVTCDVCVVGGSFGGVAAAVACRESAPHLDVRLVEDSPWIGGQATSQGVSALDEHRFIETFGGTRLYTAFREGVRRRYGGTKNYGGGWVSRLCFEPRVGLAVLEEMAAGVTIARETRLRAVERDGETLTAVVVERADGTRQRIVARLFLEATDTGELWPLAGIAHRVGCEARAETGEPHAPETADPRRMQSYTFPFAVEWRPGENHTESRPIGYERFRAEQPYSLTLDTGDAPNRRFGFFAKAPGSPGPFWTYRRITPTTAMINWPSNDYRGAPLLDGDFDEAKRLSLGFLHWLQTECPRDDGGFGYPELKLRRDVMGTADGLSMRPYVREGRRLVARTIVREQDLTGGDGARAPFRRDAVGVGLYPLDLHACAGDPDDKRSRGVPTKPYQIPVGALLPLGTTNVMAAGKAFGVTHVANGSTRVHPTEWAVGEAAGRLAAFCLERGVSPQRLADDAALLRAAQAMLLRAGVPLVWYVDLRLDDPAFAAAQSEALDRGAPSDPARLTLR
jgi:hypothetical protein